VSEEKYHLGSIPDRLEAIVVHHIKSWKADSNTSPSKASSNKRKHSKIL